MTANRSPERRLSPGELTAQVEAASERARASGALVPQDTEHRLLTDGGVTFVVGVSTSAGRNQKPAAGASGASDSDPFAPPYDTDLYVGHASPTHVALLNKFNVLEHHLLLVTRRSAEQTEMLDAADLEALLFGLAGMDGLVFYNGGHEAGASQPHKHLQLVPLPLGPSDPPLPFATMLEHTRMDGATGYVPDLPFRHAVARMRAEWLDDPARHAPEALALVERLWQALGHDPRVRHQPTPYNLLATRRWMWLVPRRQDCWERLPVNALGFAGGILAPDEDAFARLREVGPMHALQATAEPWTRAGA